MLNPNRVSFAAMLVSLAGLVGTTSAQTTWQKNHPRRMQVDHRPAGQNKRAQQDAKDDTQAA